MTTPARTAFDLGRGADHVAAVVAVDALPHRRLVDEEGLLATADRQQGRPGVARFRETIRAADAGAESPMETRLRLIIAAGGLPAPKTQHEVRSADGRFIGRVDLAYPELRIAIEYEGDHHRERATYRKDIARFNTLRAADWQTLRFTADDVFKRPWKIVTDLRQAMGRPAVATGPAATAKRISGRSAEPP